MSHEIIQELDHFLPTKVKGADNIYRKQSGGITKDFSFEYTAHAQTAETCFLFQNFILTAAAARQNKTTNIVTRN